MGTLSVMGFKGDEKITWDVNSPDQVKRAKDAFDKYMKSGARIYISKDIAGKHRGEQITEFDPNAERLIVVGQMAGG